MDSWLLRAEAICMDCGGHCCIDAHPPLSKSCYQRLVDAGVPLTAFETTGYTRLKTKENGECILSENGKCRIHSIKPETCRAGPFTFDVQGDTLEIYLKHERICPIVPLLKETPEAYRQQYERAVASITHLVRNLTPAEIAEICRIDEPDTEKVAEIPLKIPITYDHRN